MTTAKVKAAAAQTAAAAAPAAANDAAKTIEQAVAAGKETMDQVVKASQDAATKGYEKAVAMTKDQVAAAVKAQNVAMKSYEDQVAAAKDTLEAMVKSNQMLAQGLQEIAKTVVALTQETVEESVAASKQIMAAKTLRELVDLQTNLAKTQLDRMVSEGQRLSDMGAKLMEEAFAPLTERVTAQVEKLVKSAA